VFLLLYVADRQVLSVVIALFQLLIADTIICDYHTPSQQQPLRFSHRLSSIGAQKELAVSLVHGNGVSVKQK
jgi:hypothetical protein